MANPYGIEQVDVPGILSAYTNARNARTQQLLTERAMAREDAQLERETKLRTAYAKLKIPGADGGMSTAVSAYGAKDAPAAPPVLPSDFGQTPGASGPVAATAPPVGPVAAPATGAPGATPDGAPHPLQGWLDTNSGAIQDIMQQDPQSGLQIMQHFHQLDAEKQQEIRAHLEFADTVNEHGLRLLSGVHDQASWAAARQSYNTFLQQYNMPPQNLPEQYDPATVQGLMSHALSVKDQIEQMKPIVLAEGGKLVRPDGSTVAENPKAAKYQPVTIHNADGSSRAVVFNPDTGVFEDAPVGGEGAPVPSGGGGGKRTHGYSPRTSNGGDNSDVAVNGKINYLSKALGVGPDAPLSKEQISKLAEAMPATEGGVGSRAARNNNPGNLKDGPFTRKMAGYVGADSAGYAKFANAGAGQEAMVALLQHSYFDKGQRTIRDIIEGKPVAGKGGGTVAPAVSGTRSVSGNPAPVGGTLSDDAARLAAAIYKTKGTLPPMIGRTKGDVDKIMNVAARMSMDEAHTVADQTVGTWQNTHTAGQTLTAFSKGPEAKQTRSLSVALEHLELYKHAAAALQNGNTPVFNAMSQAIAKATGQPAPTNAAALHDFVMDEVTKGIVGGGMALQDRERAAEILKQNSSPAQLAGGYEQVAGLLMGQLHGLSQQYKSGTGRDDFDRFLTPMASRFFKAYRDQHGGGQAGGGNAPQVGETRRGYRFKGGDPASPSSWEKM